MKANSFQTSTSGASSFQIGALSLRNNFIWTLAGNVTYALCQWGIFIVLAKISTPEMVGQFALGLAVAAPVIIFANLSLRAVQSTDSRRDYHFSHYLALRWITTLLAILLILSIVLIARYRWETARVIMLIGLAKGFEAIGDIFYGLFQQHERMNLIGKSMIIKGCLSFVMLTAGVYLTHNVWGGAIGLALAWFLILLLYDVPNGAIILNLPASNLFLKPHLDLAALSKLIRLALPLGLTTMLISLNANIPRYFIERYLGERELGFFASIAYLMVAGTTVINALGQSASPRLAHYYITGKTVQFRALLSKLLGIGTVLGVLGILIVSIAGRQILVLLYKEEYGIYSNVFLWVTIGAAIYYGASFLGYGLTSAHYYKIQPFILSASVLFSAILSLILIPQRGILGAAWAINLSALGQLILSFICMAHVLYAFGKPRTSMQTK